MDEIYLQPVAFRADIFICQVFDGRRVLGFYEAVAGVNALGFIQENQCVGVGRGQRCLIFFCFCTGGPY
ncbi:hypothetical protein D9M69_642950 [compost metagenome]